jgi:hypothetical protein
MPEPPRLTSWLLDLFVPAGQADSIPGDLLEEFTVKAAVSRRRARLWYRRQVVRTVGHLLNLEFRRSIWATIGAVLAGLVVLPYSARLSSFGAVALLEHYPVYYYVGPRAFWLIHIAGINCVVFPLLVGWTAAAISKGREMAVAVLLSAMQGIALVSWLYFVVWLRPRQWVHLLRDPFSLARWFVLLLLPPIFLFLGAVICRARRIPDRRAPAVS